MAKPADADAEKTAARLLKQINDEARRRNINGAREVAAIPAANAVVASSPAVQVSFLRAAADQIAAIRKKLGSPRRDETAYLNLDSEDDYPWAATFVMAWLLRRNLALTGGDLAYLLARTADVGLVSVYGGNFPYLKDLVTLIEKHAALEGVDEPMKTQLGRLAKALDWGDNNAVERKLIARLNRLREGFGVLPIHPGEAWSDRALADLTGMNEKRRAGWGALIAHCQVASGGQPAAKWLASVKALIDTVGRDEFKKRVLSWFPLVDEPRTDVIERWSQYQPNPNLLIIDPHAEILKGLAWCCGLSEDRELSRALTALGLSAYRKVPGIGPRAVKIGNACITSLGMMPGLDAVGQLALLKVRVKFRPAQKGIEKAFTAAAERAGMPRDDLEEMSVPAYGLTNVGHMEESFGDFTAQLKVAGDGSSELLWLKENGKAQKSVPSSVVKNHPEALRDLKTAAKDIQKMLPAQRERLDSLYRLQKSWPLASWRERYLDHPLVGILARRLIWTFTTLKKTATGMWHNGQILDVDDKLLTALGDKTEVALWHPIGQPLDDVLAWRNWLEKHQVRQPFKQAHREIYVLTDAERTTRLYSNRYAAHVLKQHQFHALCGIRGWRNKLRLLVDQEFPPASLDLPTWDLRAEFWIEGAGDDYGTDTNEAGTFLYLTTDQVRFYRAGAALNLAHASGGTYGSSAPGPGQDNINEPLVLERVPPLVFSEVMRDVDLFVGVASVGNDPNWSDGGPDGRYRTYWEDYAFGDLSATAQTRKAVLERLIPRLKIADRCSFSDKFLQVRGDLRSYKIHLGSSNILMLPNDQYLCIVAKPSAKAEDGKLFLPFEGDGILSQILSKAILLAADTKITDPTIVSQIRSK